MQVLGLSIIIPKAIIPLLVIVTSNILLWSGVLGTDGVVISGDFTFPVQGENFQKYYFPMWNDLTSQTNFERIPRLVIMSPFIALASIGADISIVLKLFILSTYSFLTLSMYIFLNGLQEHLFKTNKPINKIFSLIGGLVFAYNPVSLQFAGGISILFSVGVLPLMLFVILRRFDDKYFPLYVSGLTLLSLGHPFTFLLNSVVSILFLLFIHLRKNAIKLISLKIGISVACFILLFSWFWIPYISNPVSAIELGREDNLSKSIFDVISNNDPIKIFLLERDRFIYIQTEPTEPFQSSFHYLSLLILVGTAISIPLVFYKRLDRKLLILLIAGFLSAATLSLGSNSNVGDLYYEFVVGSDIGWIFRSPLKFQLYQSFFISILFVMALSFLQILMRKKLLPIALSIIVVSGISFHGIYDANTSSFKPIQLPNEYFEINQILEERNDGYKVLYYPVYDGRETAWSQGHNIGTFDSKSSSIPTFEIGTNYNFVKEVLSDSYNDPSLFRSYSFYDFLTSLGIKYLVFHNDRNVDIDKENLNYLLNSYQTVLLYNSNDWYLFELKPALLSPIRAISSVGLAEGNDLIKIAKPDVGVLPAIYGLQLPRSNITKLIAEESGVEYLASGNQYSQFNIYDNYMRNWREKPGNFELSIQSTANEEYVLSITTSDNEDRLWSWLISDAIKVTDTDAYLFSFDMRTENVHGNHIKIQGYFEQESIWKDIAYVVTGIDGSTEWKNYWSIVQPSNNITELRYIINSGTVLEESRGNATSWIKSSIYNLNENGSNSATIVDYNKLSPTKWLITVNASEPYLLAFTETFDSGWSALVDMQRIESIHMNGMINGFYIEKTGLYEIVVEYEPQYLFGLGSAISAITLFSFIGYHARIWIYVKILINLFKTRFVPFGMHLLSRLFPHFD